MWWLITIFAVVIYHFFVRPYLFIQKGYTEIEKVNRKFIVDHIGMPDREYSVGVVACTGGDQENELATYFVYEFKRSTIRVEVPVYKYLINKVRVRTVDTLSQEEVHWQTMSMSTLQNYIEQVKDYV